MGQKASIRPVNGIMLPRNEEPLVLSILCIIPTSDTLKDLRSKQRGFARLYCRPVGFVFLYFHWVFFPKQLPQYVYILLAFFLFKARFN